MKRYNSKAWKILESLQNNYYSDQDILTITGFMDDEQFQRYVSDKLKNCIEIETIEFLSTTNRGS
tara:strand:- start:757 stop:951 length:195 start_codon:yes stop_codon:yes gene_type:complete